MSNTGVASSVLHLEEFGEADAGLGADVKYSLVAAGDSAKAESLVIDFVPGTNSANALDGVESGFAAAFSVLEDFVDSTSNNTVSSSIKSVSWWAFTGLGGRVEGGLSCALSASKADSVVVFGAIALSLDDVIDFVGRAGDSANS